MNRRSPRSRSNSVLFVTLIAIAIFLSACGGSSASSEQTSAPPEPSDAQASGVASPSEPVSADIGIAIINGSLASLPQVVGIEGGFFEQHGLQAELVPVQGGPELVTAVLSGSADFTLVAPALLMSSNAQDTTGENQMICAVGGQTRQTISVMVSDDWPTPNQDADYPDLLLDLEGARIGVTQIGSDTDRILRALLTDAGLDPETDVTIIASGGPPTTVAALEAGQVDAVVGFPPTPTFVEREDLGHMYLDLGADPRAPERYQVWSGVCYGTRVSTIEERPDVAGAYRTAVEEAISWMQDPANAEDLVAIAAPFLGMEPDVAAALLEQSLPAFGTDLTPEMIENVNDYLVETDQLDEPAEYDSVVWTP